MTAKRTSGMAAMAAVAAMTAGQALGQDRPGDLPGPAPAAAGAAAAGGEAAAGAAAPLSFLGALFGGAPPEPGPAAPLRDTAARPLALEGPRTDVHVTLNKVAKDSNARVAYRMVRPAPGQPKVPVAVLAPEIPDAPKREEARKGFLFFPPLATDIYGYGPSGADVFTHDATLHRDQQPSDLREGMPEQPGIGHRAYENVTGVNGAPKYIADQGRSFDMRCGLVYHTFYDLAGNSISRPVPVCN